MRTMRLAEVVQRVVPFPVSETHVRTPRRREGVDEAIERREEAVAVLAGEGYSAARVIAASPRGDVYHAVDHAGHPVAIRLIGHEGFADAEAADAFAREARAGLRLHHPHIVRSVATGRRGELRWLVMELIDGLSLRARVLSHGALSERESVHLLAQTAQALGYAWRHGVAHRDVRAANVLLASARLGVHEPFCAKLSNFGLSGLRCEGGHVRQERSDAKALAAMVCWALCPGSSDDEAGPTTLRVDGISLGTMRLLGNMLERGSEMSWEEILERARNL